jgi:hypothetical protein
MKQLFEKKELIGKTIAQVLMPKESYQDMWIKFTDNSFAVFDTEDRTEGFGQEKRIRVISDWEKDNTNEELVELGLITKSEHKNALEEEEKIHEKERCERDAIEQKRIEHYEKEQLDKLKTKYGE